MYFWITNIPLDFNIYSQYDYILYYFSNFNAGAGESGKSTLVKQMKIIHNDGFTKDELRSFRPTVMDNLLSSMKYVLSGMGLLRINLQSFRNKVSNN